MIKFFIDEKKVAVLHKSQKIHAEKIAQHLADIWGTKVLVSCEEHTFLCHPKHKENYEIILKEGK